MKCQDCAESDVQGRPNSCVCQHCQEVEDYEPEPDYGGVLGPDGKVYSDCDPGL